MQSIVKNMWPKFKRMLSKEQLQYVYEVHNINFADIERDFLLLDKLLVSTGLNYTKTDDAFSIREAGTVDRYTVMVVFADSDLDSMNALIKSYRKYKSNKLGKMVCERSENQVRIRYISYHSMLYYTLGLYRIQDGSGYSLGIVVYTMIPKIGQSYTEALLKFNKGLYSGDQRLIRQAIPYIENVQNDKIKLEDDLIYLE